MRMKHSRLSLLRREVYSRRSLSLFLFTLDIFCLQNRPPDARSLELRGKVAAARSSQVAAAAAATAASPTASSAEAAAVASTLASPAPFATAAAATDCRAEPV
ncbi:hypothetical protein PENTCL1PPCAC_24212 [Pristionchus entomophagus]|uniref:Uncharacterized protein n=1 Tax=Pristionchus entomophagus TaxID=358040 RepID=A0AAV5U6F9_9BILA|nr:hypothetical protein PENTCL1PPCAC_24212 [Pristionchus entomophagus]